MILVLGNHINRYAYFVIALIPTSVSRIGIPPRSCITIRFIVIPFIYWQFKDYVARLHPNVKFQHLGIHRNYDCRPHAFYTRLSWPIYAGCRTDILTWSGNLKLHTIWRIGIQSQCQTSQGTLICRLKGLCAIATLVKKHTSNNNKYFFIRLCFDGYCANIIKKTIRSKRFNLYYI